MHLQRTPSGQACLVLVACPRTATAARMKPARMPAAQQYPGSLLDRDCNISPFVGPVQVQRIDAGRGLFAIETVHPGTALLAANPLVHIQRPPGQSPTPMDCVPALLALKKPHMHSGSKAAAATRQQARLRAYEQLCSGRQGELLELSLSLNDLAAIPTAYEHAGGLADQHPGRPGGSAGAKGSQISMAGGAHQQARALAMDKAQCNAYAEPYQDVAAATVRGDAFKSHAGIWPAHALLNHSCSPNACTMVLGTKGEGQDGPPGGLAPTGQPWVMVVRAAHAITAGQEVTISYAGTHASSPLPVRRAALQQAFGFRCECERCLVEQDYYDGVPFGQQSLAIHRGLKKLRPKLVGALDQGDRQAVRMAADQLEATYEDAQVALSGVDDVEDRGVLECSLVLPILELAAMLLSVPPGSKPSFVQLHGREQQQQQQQQEHRRKRKKSPAKGFGVLSAQPSASAAAAAAAAAAVKSTPATEPAAAYTFNSMTLLAINAKRLQLLQQVAPASAAAVELSARQASLAKQQLGADHKAARCAQAACREAHATRYGTDASEDELEQLIAAHNTNGLIDALALAHLEAM